MDVLKETYYIILIEHYILTCSRGKNIKTFRWDHRLQIQNLFHGIQTGCSRMMVVTLGQQ